jgi:hypothetical protein
MEGEGREIWVDGREYFGSFKQGMKQGQGTLIIPE